MTLSELAEASGCSIATIKYYLREGLLQPGRQLSAKRADYDARHVARLRLIRALRDVGDLPIARIADVVAALERTDAPFHEVSGSAFHALGPIVELPDTQAARRARADVVEYVHESGWIVDDDAPALDVLAAALLAVRDYWDPNATMAVFTRYRDAFDELARGDLAMIPDPPDLQAYIAQTSVGTVLWDRAMIALRRLALEDKSRRRFG